MGTETTMSSNARKRVNAVMRGRLMLDARDRRRPKRRLDIDLSVNAVPFMADSAALMARLDRMMGARK